MPQFSLLVRIQAPLRSALSELLDSLESQTNPDWELVLVVGRGRTADWALVQELLVGRPQVRAVLRPADELLAWSCNHLFPGLGSWVGFLNQHDRLVPEALATLAGAVAAQPDVRVLYSDECHRNRFDRISFTTTKGAFDPYRLVAQEYLGALTVIETTHLAALGGFDQLASDVPTHDTYLRTLELLGPAGFAYVPAVLCQHHRTYLEPPMADARGLPHLVRYDLFAIRQHLTRRGLTAQAVQEHGTARISYHHANHPGVVVWLLVDDDAIAGLARIQALERTHGYRHARIQVLHRGSDPAAARDYLTITKSLSWTYLRSEEPLPQLLNQALPYLEHDWVLVLDGTPLGWGWLNQLMDHAQLVGVGAVGARTSDPRRITAAGLLGYRYEGWDWNTRGRFNRLQVPHQTGALGSSCLLFNARIARALAGFREDLPTLWAMDFSLRVDEAGHALLTVPAAHILAGPGDLPSPAERTLLETTWTGWRDRFGLHQPL